MSSPPLNRFPRQFRRLIQAGGIKDFFWYGGPLRGESGQRVKDLPVESNGNGSQAQHDILQAGQPASDAK